MFPRMHIARYKNPIGSASDWVSCYNKDMPVKHGIIRVTSSEVELSNWSLNPSESSIIIKNISSGNVYIGAYGVTTSNYGFRLLPEQTLSITLGPYDNIYGISDSECEVSILVVEN
jgi:hypothetical protein